MADEDLEARMRDAAALLEGLAVDRGPLGSVDPALRMRLLVAAGRVSRPEAVDKRALARNKRKGERSQVRDADRLLLARTEIRTVREHPLFFTPRRRGEDVDRAPIGALLEARRCYVCRAAYTDVHFFYDQLCPSCGDTHYEKRFPVADLRGRTALVTGARVKIGFQASLFLLRAGCSVIVTTRFPRDAARRYAADPDFDLFRDRLTIHGIDLRHTPSVEGLCARLSREHDRLDYVINNACQTVRRPAGFYDHLMALELGALDASVPAKVLAADRFGVGEVSSAALSQVALLPEDLHRGGRLFPEGQLDADLQQVDLREVNSWRLKLADVPTVELLEVQLVNAIAPFVLVARLKPLLAAVPTRDAHVVNVSAMEGQFYRTHKNDRHPHTNMAKAALNMMTRTSAEDYVAEGIYMNSVDTGWVTDEDPATKADEKRSMHDFHPPLDIVDGAARIVDPIFTGVRSGVHVWGRFLKDYVDTDW